MYPSVENKYDSTPQPFDRMGGVVKAALPTDFRPFKWNELVSRCDFVPDGHQVLEPWEGPSGFRADAFRKQIYRRQGRRRDGAKKTS